MLWDGKFKKKKNPGTHRFSAVRVKMDFESDYYGCGNGGGTKPGTNPAAAGNCPSVGLTPVRTQLSMAFTAVKSCGPVKAQ